MQVRGGRGVPSRPCRETRGLAARRLGGPVRVERSEPLQLGPPSAVDELPSGIDGCTRTRITRDGRLERGEDVLSTLHHETSNDPQLLHGQLKVTRHSAPDPVGEARARPHSPERFVNSNDSPTPCQGVTHTLRELDEGPEPLKRLRSLLDLLNERPEPPSREDEQPRFGVLAVTESDGVQERGDLDTRATLVGAPAALTPHSRHHSTPLICRSMAVNASEVAKLSRERTR